MLSARASDDAIAALEPLQWLIDDDTSSFMRDVSAWCDRQATVSDVEPLVAFPGSKRPRTSSNAPATKTATVMRRRKELIQLRSEIAALETTVRKLRESNDQGEDSTCFRKMWEEMATRQKELSDQSTLENVRLRRMLDELVRQRDALGQLLRRRTTTGFAGEHDGGNEKRVRLMAPTRPPWSGCCGYDELLDSLPRQYADTQRVLTHSRLPAAHNQWKSYYNARMIDATAMESIESVVFPFGMDDTVSEVWRMLGGVQDANPGINYESVSVTDQAFWMELTLDVQRARGRGAFKLRTVAKCIVELDRTLILWTGHAVPRVVAGADMSGISIKQRGWSVLEPMPQATLGASPTKTATRLVTYVEDVATVEHGVSKKGAKLNTLMQFLMDVYTAEGAARRVRMENRLFDRALARNQQKCSVFLDT